MTWVKNKIFMIIIDVFMTDEPTRSITGNKRIKKSDILIIRFSLKIFKISSFIIKK